MKHSARQGIKKILSDPRKLREEPVEEAIDPKGEPGSGKGFPVFVYTCMPVTRDAIIV